MSKYLFYPGCSVERSAKSYLDSLEVIQEAIDVELEEIRDWNCCGATEYISIHRVAGYALNARNLALAAGQANGNRTLTAVCSACYVNLSKTDNYLRHDDHLREQVDDSLNVAGLAYEPGNLKIRHILDVIHNDVGLEKIKSQVVRPLTGLRVAPYYGCVVVRPDLDDRFKHYEYPLSMDRILEALGAEVIDYPLKTHCCGGHMTQISSEVAFELIRRLVYAADQYNADMMVTLCPMCQLNLDAYQSDMNKHFGTDYNMPILYFTQLMGLAFGHSPEELGIGSEIVDATPALQRIGLEDAAPKAKPKRRRSKDDPSLPMPSKLDDEEVR